jgi:hypothetical protein
VKEWCDKGVALRLLSHPNKEVIPYFDNALEIDPKNANVQQLKHIAGASK